MKIPFFDGKKQHLSLRDKIYESIERVVYENSNFILGNELKEFENKFAKYCDKPYCIGVGNGTDALKIALFSLGIKNGDEVIAPDNTAIPTITAIMESGAKPVLVDVGEDYLINPEKIENAITSRTKAIMPVHLYGNPCDMNEIFKIADKYHLQIVEDCCQAHGAVYNGKKVPIGEIGCFSFYPTKNLGALGDGGAIIVNDSALEKKIRMARNYGQSDKYNAEFAGFNTRLDEIQAAILNVKLSHLDEWNSLRQQKAEIYSDALENIVKIPPKNKNGNSVYHLYVIRTDKRNELMEYLKEKEIGTLIHYPIPIHMQKAFSGLGYKKGDFPVSEKFAEEIISLPLYPELENLQIEEVVKYIKKFKGK
jgi:dTDP-4-amino-4,6-dideoxygalactose transaminase